MPPNTQPNTPIASSTIPWLSVFAAAALSSCMLNPTNDGVVSRNQEVSFTGYVFEGRAPIQVDVQRVSDNSWQPLRSVQSSSSPSQAYHGEDLYGWSASAVLPSYAWKPGLTGYTSQVRARHEGRSLFTFDMSPTEVVSCLQQSSGWSDFAETCTSEESGVVTLTTPDYEPGDVNVQVLSGGIVRRSSAHAFETTSSETSAPFTHMKWETSETDRNNWFVDVFAENHLTAHDSMFLRIPGNTSWDINLVGHFNALPRAEILTQDVTSFRSYRIYDQGACSDIRSWRSIYELVRDDLDGVLAAAAAADDADGNTIRSLRLNANPTVTPLYANVPGASESEQNGFALYIPVTAQVHQGITHAVNFHLRVKIGLETSGSDIVSKLLSVDVENVAAASTLASLIDAVVPDFIEDQIEAQLPGLETEIEEALPSIATPKPLHRLHSRPEGIEVVLAEDASDPNYAELSAFGLCTRPSVSGSKVGFSGTVFDSPSIRPDPPIFVP